MFVEMPSGSMMANGGVSCWPSIELLLVPGIPLAYWWSNGSPPQLRCLWKCLGRQNSPLNDLDVAGLNIPFHNPTFNAWRIEDVKSCSYRVLENVKIEMHRLAPFHVLS